MHYMLKVYSPIFLKAQQGAPMVVPLSESTLWTMTEAEGLDTAFMELSAEATSEATAAMSIQEDYDAREMTFTLSVKPLQHQEAWVFASRYLISDTPADLYCLEMPGVYMKGRIAGYSFSRYSDSVTIELSFQPEDRFWHGDMQVTLGGIPVPEINVLSDVPCYPDLLYEMNLVPEPLQGYWWSRLQIRFSVPTYSPAPYAEGVVEVADEELLDFDIEDLHIPSTAGLVSFSVSAYDKKASLSWQQGGGPITTVDLTAHIDWDTSTWGWMLAPGTVSITPRGYWTNGIESQYNDWPAMKGTLTIHPLWATWPKELYDSGDGFVFSPYLSPENIREGVVVLGVLGTLEPALPDYTGPTEVEPSLEKQTLPTAGRSINTDITVTPISPVNPADGIGWAESEVDEPTITDEITDLTGGPVLAGVIVKEGWYEREQQGPWRQSVIADSEKEKIIPENIREGITILGVGGSYEGEAPESYPGPYTVTPDTAAQALQTGGKMMDENLQIEAISPVDKEGGIEIWEKGTDIMASAPDSAITQRDQKIDLVPLIPTSGEGWYTPAYTNTAKEYRVGISPTETAKIIPENIREGITILGIAGTHSGAPEGYPFTTSIPVVIDRIDVGGSALTKETPITGQAAVIEDESIAILVFGSRPMDDFPSSFTQWRLRLKLDYSSIGGPPLPAPTGRALISIVTSAGEKKWTLATNLSWVSSDPSFMRMTANNMRADVTVEPGDQILIQGFIPSS